MKVVRWIIGFILLAAFLALNILSPRLSPEIRLVNPLILCCFFCLFRIALGPTPADRAVAIDILGILIVGFCGLLAVFTEKAFFLDIGIAWALQSFVATIALAKYLEGRTFDE